MGWLGSVSDPPAGKPVGWQTGMAPSLRGTLSICRLCQEGSGAPGPPGCLIRGSVPSQLDEEEERRKRRREKNKVAAARCRNKKKERTEFLQRVSRAAGQGGAPVSSLGAGLCTRGPGDVCRHQSPRNQCVPAGRLPKQPQPPVLACLPSSALSLNQDNQGQRGAGPAHPDP